MTVVGRCICARDMVLQRSQFRDASNGHTGPKLDLLG